MNFKSFSWSIIIFHSLFYSLNMIRPSKTQINLWTACYRPWSNCTEALPFMKTSYIWFMISTTPPLNTEKYKSHVIILTRQKVLKKLPITKVMWHHTRHSFIIKNTILISLYVVLDFSMHYLMIVTILIQYIKRLRSKMAHLDRF